MRSPIYYLLKRWRNYRLNRLKWVELDLTEEELLALKVLARRMQIPQDELAAHILTNALRKQESSNYYLQNWNRLSTREKQVTALMCCGYTKSEIARCLHLSVETVRTYIKNVLRKFDVHRMEELRLALVHVDFSEWAETLDGRMNLKG